MDYKINVCLSEKTYNTKPTQDDVRDMRFECAELSIDEFVKAITDGHSFCALMKDNWRNKENFKCTSMLVYDVDHSDVEMNEYISELDLVPTFAYTSPSDKDGDRRFRLIYCLNFNICSLEEYYTISKSFAMQQNMQFIDEHSFYGEQYWNGNSNCHIQIFNNILNKNNIKINNYYKRTLLDNNKSISKTITIIQHHNGVSDTFQTDYEKLSFQDFIKKYNTVYENIEHTPIEINEDEPMIHFDDNYYEIRRPWKRINGETLKIKDGEGRRRKLFLNGIIRRKINPNITFENLLFNLVYEFEYYYINDGNSINKKILYDIADNVMKAEIIDSNLGKPKYKSRVNKLYCEKYGLEAHEVWGKMRNKKQYIGEFYDPSLTDKQNIDIMSEYGLDVKLITLKRWRKENNITKYQK